MLGRTILLLVASFLSTATMADSVLTPADITAQINTVGARAALEAIYNNEKKWPQVLSGISTGTRDWLIVANLLRPASDSGSSEQLGLAVGEAIEHHPENVLSISVAVFGIGDICSGPDVDDKRYNSYKFSMAAIEKRQEMLRKVNDTKLRVLRDSCVFSLENSKKGIAHFYGVEL